MKIVYVCDTPFSGIGGAIKSATTICKGMVNREHNIRILLIGKDENLSIEGCSVDYYDQLFFYQKSNLIAKIWRCIIRCIIYIKYFNSSDIDIVHVHSSSSAKFIAILRKYGLIRSNAKFIFNDRHYFEGYSERNKKIYIKTISSWDKIICTTENNKNSWLNALKGRSKSKFVVIPNALEPFWFQYDSMKEKCIRNEFEISDNDYVIGFSGRYEPWKRWDSALDIARIMVKKPNIKFMIAIGKGSNGKEMKNIVEQFYSIAKDKVHVFIDVDFEEMEKFYYAIDFFVLTSENESFGRTLIEAMTKKCITLSTNSGGAPNVINNSEDLFEVGDALGAVKLINSYISDSEKFESQKENYLKLVRKFYQEKGMLDAIEKIYYELERK